MIRLYLWDNVLFTHLNLIIKGFMDEDLANDILNHFNVSQLHNTYYSFSLNNYESN
jgi:hypothetical protein